MLLKVFLFLLPAAAILAIFSHFYGTGAVDHNALYSRFLNGFAGLVIALWMTLSLYLSVRLIASGPFRDQVIARITFIRERDEREAMLTGKAAKTAFLTSLALLIFLFCLSCFQVSVYRVPPERAVDGKTGIVSLGLAFNILEQGNQNRAQDTIIRKNIFSYKGLPISSTAIVLMLIFWLIASYNYSMRRLLNKA
jgi:hypothetical protein